LTIWLAYLALTAPFIGPTQHPHYTNDRYCYIMGGVWSVAIAMGFLLLMRRPQLRLALPLAAVLGCCFFGWQSRVQTFFWNNSLNLHSWMAEKINGHPEAAMHEMGSANVFLLINHTNDALAAMRRAVSVNPKNADNWAFFGDILAQQGRLEPAISTYQKALTLIPEMDITRQKLAGTFAKAGLHEQAVKEYTQLIEKYTNVVALRTNVAISLEKLGRKAEAQEQLKKAQALEGKPDNASASAPGKQS
jgi:tetratricopeptide (TPR) repeat protein